MKFIYLLLFFYPFGFVQNTQDPVESTAAIFKQGDTKSLAGLLAGSVEISIDDEENVYSRAKAISVLDKFFEKNQPVAIKVMHRINSSSKFHFGVFMLTTKNGTYRIAESFKNNNGRFMLSELRIEAEKTK